MKYSALILTIILFSFVNSKIILNFQTGAYQPKSLTITSPNINTSKVIEFNPSRIEQLTEVSMDFSEPFERQCIHFKEAGNIVYKFEFSDKKGKCPEGYGEVKDVSIKIKPKLFWLCCYNKFENYKVEGNILPSKSKLYLN
jgi:hypothetical protein